MSASDAQPGAVFLNDALVPSHYGEPFAEERQLRAGQAFTLTDDEVVEVTGPDRLELLHVLSSRNFRDVPAGESTEMLILDAHGHIVHAARAVSNADTTWLITERGQAQALADHITRMTFMKQVSARVGDYRTIGLLLSATQLPQELRDVAVCCWEDPWPTTVPGGADYGVSDVDHPAFGRNRTVVVVPTEKLDLATQALRKAGLTPAGSLAWDAVRIVDWRPSLTREGAGGVLPHELDWLRTAVHLTKGCYPGQETVAKIVNLGKPPRRLAYLYLEGGEELPAVGAEISLDGRPAGVVTSVARSYEEGPVALALLKRSVPAAATLAIGSWLASQVEIVGRAGKSSASPTQRPGAGLSSRRLGIPPLGSK